MTDIAIRGKGLGKQYRIGERERYKALRDTITDAIAAPFRRLRSPHSASPGPRSDSFWALKDISFEIKRGEVVGIIGRNGAGKSTLLKILSRITAPTAGEVEIRGRVGSLLEVGTGFHPELTGRENIYLNGAILGMRRAETERKFDEIVAFAEIEKFIDTPVKRYSSGMYIRLAFAVAAHLEPEILLVDEVLAVGDAEFQKKCLGKMGEVAKQGRTCIFVSHNLAMIQRLCSDGILLQDGRLVLQGSGSECVRRYSETLDAKTNVCARTSSDGLIKIISVRTLNNLGAVTNIWEYGQALTVEVDLEIKEARNRLAVDLAFYNVGGQKLFALQSDRFIDIPSHESGRHKILFVMENPGLTIPEMYLDVGVRTAAAGYEALLTYAAFLFANVESLPAYVLYDSLVTPIADVRVG